MIFSAEKWNNGKELKAVMKVNTAISFDMMEAPLRNAFRQYLVPLLGDAMVGYTDSVRIRMYWNRILKGQPNESSWTVACWRFASGQTRTWRSGMTLMKSACASPMLASSDRSLTTTSHSSRCISIRKITCGHRYGTKDSMRLTNCLNSCMPI